MLTLPKPQQYLCIASPPTPNGGLHLGHIGGPYLRMDIQARALTLWGHQVKFISGTDPYDSYTAFKAYQVNQPTDEVANLYYEQIHKDLNLMSISIDRFINPLTCKDYKNTLDKVYKELMNAKGIINKTEEIFVDEEEYELAGAWLSGNCPHCGLSIQGYFCEACGSQFDPEMVVNPKITSNNIDVVKKITVKSRFMSLPQEVNLDQCGLYSDIANNMEKHLLQTSHARISHHLDWGLPTAEGNENYFNYGTSYWYFMMLGLLAFKQEQNPFAMDSPVELLISFGFDNAIPFLSSIYGTTHHLSSYKAFSAYHCNHFYLLDGEKFSTSRQHAIWVKDLEQLTSYQRDMLRLFMATIDISTEDGNFKQEKAKKFIYQTLEKLANRAANTTVKDIKLNKSDSSSIIELLNSYLLKQQQYLAPLNFKPHQAAELIIAWLEINTESMEEEYWWWLGLSLLGFPFMPNLCLEIWHYVGMVNQPRIEQYLDINSDDTAKFELNSLFPTTEKSNESATL